MAKVNFIRKSSGVILADYRYEGGRLNYTTKIKIQDSELFKKGKIHKDHPDADDLNGVLDVIGSHIVQVKNLYTRSMEELTIDKFKEELDKRLNRDKKKEAPKVRPDVITDFAAYCEEVKKNENLATGTRKRFPVTLQKLKDFASDERYKRLEFKDIDMKFYKEFTSWMTKQNYTKSYQGHIISVLKWYLNDRWDERRKNQLFNEVSFPGWLNKKFKRLNEEADNVYLNMNHLARIESKDFNNNPRLERIRNAFLLGCYTGLRFSDLVQIRSTHFSKRLTKDGKPYEVLTVVPQKTGKKVVIPVHPSVKKIIQYYENKPPEEQLRIPTNQVFNRYVKEVLKACKLTEKITIVKPIDGKRVATESPLWEEVSSHTARRSFATNAYKDGVPAITIMRITGHRTEKAFLKYIKVDAEDHAEIMAESTFFNHLSIAK